MICTIIQQLFGQSKLITQFDGRRCIDEISYVYRLGLA